MREGKIFSRAIAIFQKALLVIFLTFFSRNQANFGNHGYTNFLSVRTASKSTFHAGRAIGDRQSPGNQEQQSKWRPSEKFFESMCKYGKERDRWSR